MGATRPEGSTNGSAFQCRPRHRGRFRRKDGGYRNSLARNSWQTAEWLGADLASASFHFYIQFFAVLAQIARQPIEKRGIPELTILRLQDPVAFVWKNYQF